MLYYVVSKVTLGKIAMSASALCDEFEKLPNKNNVDLAAYGDAMNDLSYRFIVCDSEDKETKKVLKSLKRLSGKMLLAGIKREAADNAGDASEADRWINYRKDREDEFRRVTEILWDRNRKGLTCSRK